MKKMEEDLGFKKRKTFHQRMRMKDVASSTEKEELIPRSKENAQKDYLTHLPYEIVLQVLHRLDLFDILHLSVVSKHWNRICREDEIWKDFRLDLQIFPKTFNWKKWTVDWSSRIRKLKVLEISKNIIIQESDLKVLLPFCSELKVLNAIDCKALTNETIGLLGKFCKKIEIFLGGSEVQNDHFTNWKITEKAIEGLSNCTEIHTLDISTWNIGDIGLIQVGMKFKKLKNLNISFVSVNILAFEEFVRHAKNLTVLEARGILQTPHWEILSKSYSLKILDARNSIRVTEKKIRKLVKSSNLELLILADSDVQQQSVYQIDIPGKKVSFSYEEVFQLEQDIWLNY